MRETSTISATLPSLTDRRGGNPRVPAILLQIFDHHPVLTDELSRDQQRVTACPACRITMPCVASLRPVHVKHFPQFDHSGKYRRELRTRSPPASG